MNQSALKELVMVWELGRLLVSREFGTWLDLLAGASWDGPAAIARIMVILMLSIPKR